MSKIIKKEELDLVIENVLKENGIVVESKSKPDFLDLDNDGDEDESMKKASKDKEEMEESEEMVEDCDVVEESTNKLKSEIESSKVELIKEDLDNFKRLMNHRN